jgi:hypothetical protein
LLLLGEGRASRPICHEAPPVGVYNWPL